jgi:hypothetical protein
MSKRVLADSSKESGVETAEERLLRLFREHELFVSQFLEALSHDVLQSTQKTRPKRRPHVPSERRLYVVK